MLAAVTKSPLSPSNSALESTPLAFAPLQSKTRPSASKTAFAPSRASIELGPASHPTWASGDRFRLVIATGKSAKPSKEAREGSVVCMVEVVRSSSEDSAGPDPRVNPIPLEALTRAGRNLASVPRCEQSARDDRQGRKGIPGSLWPDPAYARQRLALDRRTANGRLASMFTPEGLRTILLLG